MSLISRAFAKVDETKATLGEAQSKVETVIKMNVILIAVVVVFLIVLVIKMRK